MKKSFVNNMKIKGIMSGLLGVSSLVVGGTGVIAVAGIVSTNFFGQALAMDGDEDRKKAEEEAAKAAKEKDMKDNYLGANTAGTITELATKAQEFVATDGDQARLIAKLVLVDGDSRPSGGAVAGSGRKTRPEVLLELLGKIDAEKFKNEKDWKNILIEFYKRNPENYEKLNTRLAELLTICEAEELKIYVKEQDGVKIKESEQTVKGLEEQIASMVRENKTSHEELDPIVLKLGLAETNLLAAKINALSNILKGETTAALKLNILLYGVEGKDIDKLHVYLKEKGARNGALGAPAQEGPNMSEEDWSPLEEGEKTSRNTTKYHYHDFKIAKNMDGHWEKLGVGESKDQHPDQYYYHDFPVEKASPAAASGGGGGIEDEEEQDDGSSRTQEMLDLEVPNINWEKRGSMVTFRSYAETTKPSGMSRFEWGLQGLREGGYLQSEFSSSGLSDQKLGEIALAQCLLNEEFSEWLTEYRDPEPSWNTYNGWKDVTKEAQNFIEGYINKILEKKHTGTEQYKRVERGQILEAIKKAKTQSQTSASTQGTGTSTPLDTLIGKIKQQLSNKNAGQESQYQGAGSSFDDFEGANGSTATSDDNSVETVTRKQLIKKETKKQEKKQLGATGERDEGLTTLHEKFNGEQGDKEALAIVEDFVTKIDAAATAETHRPDARDKVKTDTLALFKETVEVVGPQIVKLSGHIAKLQKDAAKTGFSDGIDTFDEILKQLEIAAGTTVKFPESKLVKHLGGLTLWFSEEVNTAKEGEDPDVTKRRKEVEGIITPPESVTKLVAIEEKLKLDGKNLELYTAQKTALPTALKSQVSNVVDGNDGTTGLNELNKKIEAVVNPPKVASPPPVLESAPLVVTTDASTSAASTAVAMSNLTDGATIVPVSTIGITAPTVTLTDETWKTLYVPAVLTKKWYGRAIDDDLELGTGEEPLEALIGALGKDLYEFITSPDRGFDKSKPANLFGKWLQTSSGGMISGFKKVYIKDPQVSDYFNNWLKTLYIATANAENSIGGLDKAKFISEIEKLANTDADTVKANTAIAPMNLVGKKEVPIVGEVTGKKIDDTPIYGEIANALQWIVADDHAVNKGLAEFIKVEGQNFVAFNDLLKADKQVTKLIKDGFERIDTGLKFEDGKKTEGSLIKIVADLLRAQLKA